MERGKYDISPFSRGFPPERDDEGIVPYIPPGVHAIQLGVLNPSDCGRLVAAPTVVPNVCHSTGCGWENLLGRDDVGIVPYIPSGCIPFNGER